MARWIQQLNLKKGALHRQLGFPEDKKIPVGLLQKIVNANIGDKIAYKVNGKRKVITITRLLKKRATLALTFRRISK